MILNILQKVYGTFDPVSATNLACYFAKSKYSLDKNADLVELLQSNKILNVQTLNPGFFNSNYAPLGYFNDFWLDYNDLNDACKFNISGF
jgi:hypothetical protein